MPRVLSRFRPAWWLRGAHAQTIWPALFRRRARPPFEWERLELADGDFLDLAWNGPKGAPTVLVLHGLEGGIDSHYAGGILQVLSEAGYRACLMHFRGCGREQNRLDISYHSGKTDDPQRVLEHIERVCGEPPLAAVGVSLGGNVLLKWLGETGQSSPLKRAVAISVPFQLAACAARLERGLSKLYQRHLVGSLRRRYQDKYARRLAPLDVDVTSLRTFRAFDDKVTAPLHGFAGVDNYYARCSSAGHLDGIRVPTLLLQARDDPFMSADALPDPDTLPPDVYLELSEKGGHVGFIGGPSPMAPTFFIEQRISEWLRGAPAP